MGAIEWAFDTQIMYSSDQIKKWVQDINDRGTNQKVLLSILDTPETHWYPDVDIDEFAQNISKSVNEWGLGGIDVDAESGMIDPSNHYVSTFVHLIKSLRRYLSSDKIISYTCYTQSSYDTNIISQCQEDIDYINTMAYWNDTDGQIALYQHYAKAIGDADKVGVGVKAGNGGDSTNIDTVKDVANWFRDNNAIKQKRMMLWSLTRDIKPITTKVNGAYLDTIYQNIVPNNNMNAVQPHSFIFSSPKIECLPPSPCIQPMNLSCPHTMHNIVRSTNKNRTKYINKNKVKNKNRIKYKECCIINEDMIEITVRVNEKCTIL